MSKGYDEAAEEAQDRGVLDPWQHTREEVRAEMHRFLSIEHSQSQGGMRLLEGATDAAMDQEVRFADGAIAGKRGDMQVWSDRWGNLMGRNEETGTARKLLDSEDR